MKKYTKTEFKEAIIEALKTSSDGTLAEVYKILYGDLPTGAPDIDDMADTIRAVQWNEELMEVWGALCPAGSVQYKDGVFRTDKNIDSPDDGIKLKIGSSIEIPLPCNSEPGKYTWQIAKSSQKVECRLSCLPINEGWRDQFLVIGREVGGAQVVLEFGKSGRTPIHIVRLGFRVVE